MPHSAQVSNTTSARTSRWFTTVAVLCLACGSEATPVAPELDADAATSIPTTEAPAQGNQSCKPGKGATGSPQRIPEVVALINSLPHPVTIPCFLKSLDRPLVLNATANVISAQPAEGYRSPRLFLLKGPLSMSIVPAGGVRNYLELGEQTPDGLNSIKAEIHFPVVDELEDTAPFLRLFREEGEGTVCYTCHSPEKPATSYGIDGAFESPAYRPNPMFEVNFDYVKYQYETCDASTEPDRCATLSALFGGGEVVRGEFPKQMAIFN